MHDQKYNNIYILSRPLRLTHAMNQPNSLIGFQYELILYKESYTKKIIKGIEIKLIIFAHIFSPNKTPIYQCQERNYLYGHGWIHTKLTIFSLITMWKYTWPFFFSNWFEIFNKGRNLILWYLTIEL